MTLRCLEPSGNGAEGTPGRWGPAGPAEEPTPEAARLAKALRELSHTGWYWGNMTVNEAKEKLKEAPEGTFLIRDSSHSDYLLTISVKTSAGPTNLRIEYQDGKFRLDSIICVKSKLKQFDSVVHLIDYYVQMCKDKRTGPEAPQNGTVHLYLTKPLYTSAPPLQHLCRLTINKCTGTVWGLPLPTRLKDYLEEYKFQGPLNSARVLQHKEQPAEGSGPLLPETLEGRWEQNLPHGVVMKLKEKKHLKCGTWYLAWREPWIQVRRLGSRPGSAALATGQWLPPLSLVCRCTFGGQLTGLETEKLRDRK